MFKNKKKTIVKFISMIAMVSCPIVVLGSCGNQTLTDVTIKVFQTSDIHGYIVDTSAGNNNEDEFQYRLAYMANIFEQARNNNAYDDVLLLDCGDVYQGQIISNFTNGSALRAALDLMKYDATVLGNHEFDWGLDESCDSGYVKGYEIGQYVKPTTQIPILASNLYDKETGQHSSYTKDYAIVNKANKRIALIGYVPDYSCDILAQNIAPYTIDEDLDKFIIRIKEINEKEKPDATIVMAHANPIPLADKFDKKDVQLVAGGHDHDFKAGVSKKTSIPFIQADCFAQGYSEAIIKINHDNQVTVEEPNFVDIVSTDDEKLYKENSNNLNKEILKLSCEAWEIIKPKVNKQIGYIEQSIEKKGYINPQEKEISSTTGGNWVTSLFKKAMNLPEIKAKNGVDEDIVVDIAFYNTGGIRTSFIVEDGEMEKDITYGDIYTMLPFNNPLLIYELTAQELKQHLINSIREDNYGDQMTGLCFEYKKDKNSNEVEIVKMYLVDDDGNKTAIDVNDTTTRYTICLPRYNATLEGSVTKDKTPINNEAIAIVDNQAIIEILEYERGQNKPSKFKIEVDLEQRAIKVDE